MKPQKQSCQVLLFLLAYQSHGTISEDHFSAQHMRWSLGQKRAGIWMDKEMAHIWNLMLLVFFHLIQIIIQFVSKGVTWTSFKYWDLEEETCSSLPCGKLNQQLSLKLLSAVSSHTKTLITLIYGFHRKYKQNVNKCKAQKVIKTIFKFWQVKALKYWK